MSSTTSTPVYLLLDRESYSQTAKSLHRSALDGDKLALRTIQALGGDPNATSHVELLDLLARASHLHSWEIARQVLPDGEESPINKAKQLLRAKEQSRSKSQHAYRFIPSESLEVEAHTLNEVEARAIATAQSSGFKVSHLTKKKLELYRTDPPAVAYLDRNRSGNGILAVVVPPWVKPSDVASISGASSIEAGRFYHSSNMRTFPRHEHRGKNQIPYGYSVVCDTADSLAAVLDLI